MKENICQLNLISQFAICEMSLALYSALPAFHAPVLAAAPRATVSMMAKSQALPFLEKPVKLDGKLVGDVVRLLPSSHAAAAEAVQLADPGGCERRRRVGGRSTRGTRARPC